MLTAKHCYHMCRCCPYGRKLGLFVFDRAKLPCRTALLNGPKVVDQPVCNFLAAVPSDNHTVIVEASQADHLVAVPNLPCQVGPACYGMVALQYTCWKQPDEETFSNSRHCNTAEAQCVVSGVQQARWPSG
jgi:hypothetical protein